MLNIEKLYNKSGELNRLCVKNPIEPALGKLFDVDDAGVGAECFLSLIDEAKEEVEACRFRSLERQARFLEGLRSFRTAFVLSLAKRDKSATGPLLPPQNVEKIGAIYEALSEILDDVSGIIDRQEFLAATQNLISEIDAWSMEEYGKRSLLLSLQLISAQLDSSQYQMSDQEVRRRVKSLVASFCVEFCEMDKEFEGRFEKIKRWARLGYEGAPTPLGLTSQFATVAGLLPKP